MTPELRERLRDAGMLVGALAAVVGLLGVLVLVSGIVPIGASSGHWTLTSSLLEFASSRSVATWSVGVKPPPLEHPADVLKGAGHYHTGCRPCHGSPDLPQPRIALALTPPAPFLPPELGKWKPQELFTIVKHGIKFTGMPAWPSYARDDEVWSMVAFLLVLPELDAAEYATLVHGESEAPGVTPMRDLAGTSGMPASVRESCGRCHGTSGLGRGTGAFPKLAGQREAYLRASLEAYANGARHSGVMEPVAAGLGNEQIEALARYYAALPPPDALQAGGRDAIERGRKIAHEGVPEKLVPSCADCHGPTPGGYRTNAHYPRLAGQYPEYLELQLDLFQQKKRGGTAYGHLMHQAARKLTKEQMRDVALYYATLPPDASP